MQYFDQPTCEGLIRENFIDLRQKWALCNGCSLLNRLRKNSVNEGYGLLAPEVCFLHSSIAASPTLAYRPTGLNSLYGQTGDPQAK
jgi:hypothetical protein